MINIEDLFVKVIVNRYPSCESKMIDGRPRLRAMFYRREDLSKWAAEAFERGEHWFYCEPVNPENPNGKLRLCEPKHMYKLRSGYITEEEYEELLNQYNDDDDDYDMCYECTGYGDDYYEDEDGELVPACDSCPFNENNWEDGYWKDDI